MLRLAILPVCRDVGLLTKAVRLVDWALLVRFQLSLDGFQVHLLLASLLYLLCAMLVNFDLVGHEARQALPAF